MKKPPPAVFSSSDPGLSGRRRGDAKNFFEKKFSALSKNFKLLV